MKLTLCALGFAYARYAGVCLVAAVSLPIVAAIQAGPAKTVDDQVQVELQEAPALSAQYLKAGPTKGGTPSLVVAYYNATQGLLAGYESSAGKRLVFRSSWRSDGQVSPQIAHLNSVTGKVELLMGPSRRIDPATGRRAQVYEVAGIDLMTHLKKKGDAEKNAPPNFDEMDSFMIGDAGKAFSEAVPALYAKLQALEADARLAQLQAPFGGILTALQLNTGLYGGFDHADTVLGTPLANELRAGCSEGTCKFRGRHFRVQHNGLFDVLSERSSVAKAKAMLTEVGPAPSRTLLQVLVESRKNGNGICDAPGACFGGCGPGCFTPGDIYTSECWGHDMCVCKWGDAACAVTFPEYGCEECSSLISAIGSYLVAFFQRLFSPNETEPDPEPETWW